MAVLSFSSAKGGVGKTTLAVNVAVEFALRGISACVLDCDLNQHATQFGEAFGPSYPEVPVRFVGGVNKANIIRRLKEADVEHDVVAIDLPAGTSELSLRAIMMSSLVVIPAQMTSLDVKDAARTAIQISEASELSGHHIPSVLVWTMVGTRFETTTERIVREGLVSMLTDPSRAILSAPLLRYDAYPAGFVHGFVPRQVAAWAGKSAFLPGSPLDPVRIPPSAFRAAENIAAVADGMLARLQAISRGEDPGRVCVLPEVIDEIRRASAGQETA